MKLAYMHPDDLIEVNKGGRRMVGRVVEIRDGVVQFEPLCRGISYRHAAAREIIAHWRKTGRRRDPRMGHTRRKEPLCRARSCRCASRHEDFGRDPGRHGALPRTFAIASDPLAPAKPSAGGASISAASRRQKRRNA
jgi:hypothetical protein